jgi:hypothetical protein
VELSDSKPIPLLATLTEDFVLFDEEFRSFSKNSECQDSRPLLKRAVIEF